MSPLLILCCALLAFCTIPIEGQSFSAGATLNGAGAGTNSSGFGTVVVILTYPNASLSMTNVFSQLQGTTTIAHIHCCTTTPGMGSAAPATESFPGYPTGVQSGTYSATLNMSLASSYGSSFLSMYGGDPATAWLGLFSGIASGVAYWNIHTTMYPNAEISGFFPATATVSPPASPSASPIAFPSASPSPSANMCSALNSTFTYQYPIVTICGCSKSFFETVETTYNCTPIGQGCNSWFCTIPIPQDVYTQLEQCLTA